MSENETEKKIEGPRITIHPAAALFPMMSDTELAELGQSIKNNGLREPIAGIMEVGENRTDWIVLDGRNRLEAIRRHLELTNTHLIGNDYIKPINLDRLGCTAEEYVMMANIERRNLTAPQRKELAGKLAVMISEAQKDKPKAEQVDATAAAAKRAGVSRRTAATAKQKVKPKAPGVVPDVKAKKAESKPKALATAGRMLTVLEACEDFENLHTWEVEQVQNINRMAGDVAELTQLDLERRVHDLKAKIEELSATKEEDHIEDEIDFPLDYEEDDFNDAA